MTLTRREILSELMRLGVKGFSALRKCCREFEVFQRILGRSN